jgi:integrase
MATIEERVSEDGKKTFRVKVRLKGFPEENATFHRKSDASKWAQNTEAALREGRHFPKMEAKKHTFENLVDRYIANVLAQRPRTLKDRKIHLEVWRKRLGKYLLADINSFQISDIKTELLNQFVSKENKRSPATVNRYLATLSCVFTYAIRELGWLQSNPLGRIKKDKESRGRIRFLSDVERLALLKACKAERPELYIIVVLALSTGMRLGELINLTWHDIDFQRGIITIQTSKNGERRIVPLQSHALDVLKEHSKVIRLDSTLLFPRPTVPLQPIDIRPSWENALKNSNIQDFRFHDLRHSCASYLAMNGATPSELAEILGHKTLSMVKRYAHLSESHTKSVVMKMNDKIFG